MDHFNRLSPEQAEALAILAEECGEVVQVVGKILRHGLNSTHPNGGWNNRQLLAREIGDVRAAIDVLNALGLVFDDEMQESRLSKLRRLAGYVHHLHAALGKLLGVRP